MNLEELSVQMVSMQIEKGNKTTGLPRRVFYGRAIEQAKEIFPEFAEAVQVHTQELHTSKKHISPFDSSKGGIFQDVFRQVPGLSHAYGMITRRLYQSLQPSDTVGRTQRYLPSQHSIVIEPKDGSVVYVVGTVGGNAVQWTTKKK